MSKQNKYLNPLDDCEKYRGIWVNTRFLIENKKEVDRQIDFLKGGTVETQNEGLTAEDNAEIKAFKDYLSVQMRSYEAKMIQLESEIKALKKSVEIFELDKKRTKSILFQLKRTKERFESSAELLSLLHAD